MKRALMYSILAAVLGGCVAVPYGTSYRYSDDGYRYRSYSYSNPGYGYYSYGPRYYSYDYGYPRSYGYYGFRYQDHGG